MATPAPALGDADSPAPALKWAGGKRWQVPYLRPLWAGHARRRLVEPFCGGMAVTLALRPARALVNDLNPHVVSFYRWLKRGFEVDIPLDNAERVYYRHRRRFNALIADNASESREAAALFYYLNRTGYNGLCRFNRRGEFNVPFGRYKTIDYVRDWSRYAQVFRCWEFTSVDVEELPLEPADWIYADPPYDVPFTRYGRTAFTWDDQVRTATFLARHKGPVVLVNQATDRIRALYTGLGFAIRCLDAPRRISCTGDRTPAREILATRNL
jgi:DNA adenine methylase